MDLLRQIVGGPKHRYKEAGYNLDLTYITERVIAMAFPASGIEKLYRNSIDVIASFLEEKHPKSSLIINISGREVEQEKLSNVEAYEWEDHCAPTMETLFIITQRMYNFLSKNTRNVVVVHCNHGKGRTGTLICCFLLYCGLVNSPDKAMTYYARKRFLKEGMGVTQPCQIRYIRYFYEILNGSRISPTVVYLEKVVLTGEHKISIPYAKIKSLRLNKEIQTSKSSVNQIQNIIVAQTKQTFIHFRNTVQFAGDAMLLINNEGFMGAKKVARMCFNTAFLPQDNKFVFKLNELSPDSLMKAGIFDPNFTICKCVNNIPMHLRCNKCKPKVAVEQQHWDKIYSIVDKRPQLKPDEAKRILFGDPDKCDIQEFIKEELPKENQDKN